MSAVLLRLQHARRRQFALAKQPTQRHAGHERTEKPVAKLGQNRGITQHLTPFLKNDGLLRRARCPAEWHEISLVAIGIRHPQRQQKRVACCQRIAHRPGLHRARLAAKPPLPRDPRP